MKEFLNAIMPIVYILVGALISPLITSRFEKQKRKSTIKSDLAEIVYQIFNVLKAHTAFTNRLDLYDKILYAKQIVWQTASIEERVRVEKDYDFYLTERDKSVIGGMEAFNQMCKYEAKLISLTLETNSFLGSDQVRSIKKIRDEILIEVNNRENSNLMKDVEFETVNQGREILGKKLELKDGEYQKDAMNYIAKIEKLF